MIVKNALDRLQATYRSNDEVRKEIANLTADDAKRNAPFAERIEKQNERFNLPLSTDNDNWKFTTNS